MIASRGSILDPKKKQALAYISDYISKDRYDTNWPLAVDISGYSIDWNLHERLTRAQFFGDADYPDAVYRFISEVYETNVEAFNAMMWYIFDQKIPEDQNVKVSLGNLGVISGGASAFPSSPKLSIPTRFIEVDTFPDDFYRELVNLINKAHQTELYQVTPLLMRKLLENILVDILRSYYGTRDVSVFYDTNHGKFHDFSVLIQTTRSKLEDFKWCGDLLNEKLLAQLDKYREQGNASAHSIVMRLGKEELDKNREELTWITRQLFKAFSVISTARGHERFS